MKCYKKGSCKTYYLKFSIIKSDATDTETVVYECINDEETVTLDSTSTNAENMFYD